MPIRKIFRAQFEFSNIQVNLKKDKKQKLSNSAFFSLKISTVKKYYVLVDEISVKTLTTLACIPMNHYEA